ncbi:hypothetical protein QFC19_003640 [Naganishia cerealis]|uniref:Uncharacterized protein n=1 Tax=Naganishia cerealis TaxID=610337 RepID=A0ACC2W246_9TREE|nr:hypothetical protein QFC19_003640 [Naganishia cerealis]
MSAAHPTHHVPSAFTLKLGVVSSAREVPSALKCPGHVKIAFDARWYALDSAAGGASSGGAGGGGGASPGVGAAWTPWVGNVDIEEYYARQHRMSTLAFAREHAAGCGDEYSHEKFTERILKGSSRPTASEILHAETETDRAILRKMRTRPRPGYQLGVCGKMQLFIMQTVDQPLTDPDPHRGNHNHHPQKRCIRDSDGGKATTTPVKVFLVDYDLSALQPGGRLLYKERAYQTVPHEESSTTTMSASGGVNKTKAREVLKYAFELHFICAAKPSKPTTKDATSGNAMEMHHVQPVEGGSKEKKRKRHDNTTPPLSAPSENPHIHKSYYLGKQIRLVFPTSSTTLHATDGTIPSPSPSSPVAPSRAPSVRVERMIEVQNPPPSPSASKPTPNEAEQSHHSTATHPHQVRGLARASPPHRESATSRGGRVPTSTSFTSESWEGLRARWWAEQGAASASAEVAVEDADAETETDVSLRIGSPGGVQPLVVGGGGSAHIRTAAVPSSSEESHRPPSSGGQITSSLGLAVDYYTTRPAHQHVNNIGKTHNNNNNSHTTSTTNNNNHYSPASVVTALPPSLANSALVFTRSPTPVAGLSLKSPSLLTARLEEMSAAGLAPSSPPAIGKPFLPQDAAAAAGGNDLAQKPQVVVADSASASGAGRRRIALWPAAGDEDHERLLSESLKKLPISYR